MGERISSIYRIFHFMEVQIIESVQYMYMK